MDIDFLLQDKTSNNRRGIDHQIRLFAKIFDNSTAWDNTDLKCSMRHDLAMDRAIFFVCSNQPNGWSI